jgi:hypothetical protein
MHLEVFRDFLGPYFDRRGSALKQATYCGVFINTFHSTVLGIFSSELTLARHLLMQRR